MDASEIYSKRLNDQRKWKIHFSRWTNKHYWRRSGTENIHLDTGPPISRSLENQKGLQLHYPQDSYLDACEARIDFWSMSGNFICRHHVEPRVKLYSPREESFPILLKYIDVSRTTHTNLDVMQERRIDDYWNIDGSRDLSDSWTGFTQFTLSSEKPPDGYVWSGRRLTKRQATPRPDHLWPEFWRGMARSAKLKEKQKWSIEKPKLDNARRLRGIFFIDPEDKEFKEDHSECKKKIGNTNGSSHALQDMQEEQSIGRPVARLMISSLNLRVSWKPVNPQECVWKNLYRIIMRTILQEEGTIHYNITIWYTNLFLCLKQ